MPPSEDSNYPYQKPRWLLWVLVTALLVALVVAFILGPGDPGPKTSSIAAPDTSATTVTLGTQAATTTVTTASHPTTTTGGAHATTTATPAATTTSVPPVGPPPTVALAHCTIDGDLVTAEGTVTNHASAKENLRAHALVVDANKATVADLSTDVANVDPNSTVAWSISKHLDASALAQAASCKSGPVDLLP